VRFGEVIGEAVTKPGLHFKTPLIDEVKPFEKRWLEWDGEPNQITTLDKRYIYVDVFARWRIVNPILFIETLRDEQSAQGRLDDIMDNATRNVVANHNLIEVIRSTNRPFDESNEEALLTGELETTPGTAAADKAPASENAAQPGTAKAKPPQKSIENESQLKTEQQLYSIHVGREKLSELIIDKAEDKVAQLGIELRDVQFQRIDYIESVRTKVFDRMISERKRVAEAFRSQGRGQSAEILGQTERELKKISSEAYRTAQEIMGRADAEAASIYAGAYERDPEFYSFVKTMESYRETLDDKSWLVLSTDADYAQYLKKMERIKR
jgi:modulator of FtsH protease HflC